MQSAIGSITKSQLFQSFLTCIVTSVSTVFLTSVVFVLQGIIDMLNAGNYALDFKQIGVKLLTALLVGLLTGASAFIGSVLKKLGTDENGKLLGKI